MHLEEMEAARAGMPVACVRHENLGGNTVKDIHMENFTISVGGRDLIVDGSVTLSFGRHYGGWSFMSSFLSWHWTFGLERIIKRIVVLSCLLYHVI